MTKQHVIYEAKSNLFRIIRPDTSHKSYRFQEYLTDGKKCQTIQTDEIKTFNQLFKAGTLSDAGAENRAEAIKLD